MVRVSSILTVANLGTVNLGGYGEPTDGYESDISESPRVAPSAHVPVGGGLLPHQRPSSHARGNGV
jgi:hypothetical protein